MLTSRTYARPVGADAVSRDVEELVAEHLATEVVAVQPRDLHPVGGSPVLGTIGAGIVPSYNLGDGGNSTLVFPVRVPTTWASYSVYAIGALPSAGSGDVTLRLDRANVASSAGGNVNDVTGGSLVTFTAGALYIVTEHAVSSGLTGTGWRTFQIGRRGAEAADTLAAGWSLIRVELRRTA